MTLRTFISRGSIQSKSSRHDKSRSRRRALASLVAAVTWVDCASRLHATTQTSTWSEGSNVLWNNPLNWSPSNTFPNNGNAGISDFNVVIPGLLMQPSVNVNTTIDAMTLYAGAILHIDGGNNLTLDAAAITEFGIIQININDLSTSTLTYVGATLSGTGTITLDSPSNGAVLAGTLTQPSEHTIGGLGEITAALTNNGTVNSYVSGEAITLLNSNTTNNSLMEATGGGFLNISTSTITQGTGGQIAASGGIVQLTGGATVSGGTLNGGIITDTAGGTNTIGGLTNNATLNVAGAGNLNISSAIVNNGVLNVDSGSSSTSTVTASGAITGTGTININPGGLLAFAHSVGGSSQNALSITGSGTMDLNNNHLFINYGAGADPIASIRALIVSGYNGGTWTGAGINSSAAHANAASYGIGYADSADPGNPAALSSGQIEIKYTLLGDVDLNGIVNGIDFGILAANFNKAVTSWDQGDFNYDNIVNGVDFGELAANFNKGASGAAAGGSALSDPALVAFAQANGLMADVPEPASAGLAAIGVTTLLARLRRPFVPSRKPV